jgi:hypothetical protein
MSGNERYRADRRAASSGIRPSSMFGARISFKRGAEGNQAAPTWSLEGTTRFDDWRVPDVPL